MATNYYQQTAEDVTIVCNQSIDMVLENAKVSGIITEEQFQKLIRLRVIVTDRKNLFSTLFDYIMGQKDQLHIRVVSIQDRPMEGK